MANPSKQSCSKKVLPNSLGENSIVYLNAKTVNAGIDHWPILGAREFRQWLIRLSLKNPGLLREPVQGHTVAEA